MELFPVSRYENIADRIKRLSNLNQISASTAQDTMNSISTAYKRPEFKQNKINLPVGQKIIKEDIKYSRYNTRESQKHQNRTQQKPIYPDRKQTKSISIMKQLMQKLNNNKISTRNNDKIDKVNQSFTFMDNQDNINEPLYKDKNESVNRIQEILDSYNKYKLNKRQFLQSIGKNITQNNMLLSNCKNILQEQHQNNQSNDQQLKTFRQKQEEDNQIQFCKFQRTSRYQQKQNKLFRQLSNQDLLMKVQNKIKNKSVNKASSQSIIHRPNLNLQTIDKNSMFSPRGGRVPGKICKNLERALLI